MPHQCTNCARRFDDGSKEMLSGCPNCGGTKFQFLPAASDGGGPGEPQAAPESAEPPEPPEPDTSAVAERVGRATAKLRNVVGDGPPERETTDAESSSEFSDLPRDDATVVDGGESEPADATESTGTTGGTEATPARAAAEDGAQSSARSEMVSTDELPDGLGGFGVDHAGGAADDDGSGVPDGTITGRGIDGEQDGRVVDTPSEDRPDLADLREELNDQFEGIRIREPGQYELNLMELYEREETIIALQENGRYVIEPPESWRGD